MVEGGASAQDIVERVGMFGRSGGFGADQVEIQRDRNLTRYLVKQPEQVVGGLLEAIGPDMKVGLGVDQLGIDADPISNPAHAALQDVTNAQVATDLSAVDQLIAISERRVAGDHDHVGNAR